MTAIHHLILLVAAMGLPASHAANLSSDQLRAGVARIDLTPPLAMKAALGGYGARLSRPATGVHDRVWAKALVLQADSRRRVLITADVLAFPPGFREAVALALRVEGWQVDDLLLLPSHTHTSLDMTALDPRNTFQIPQLGLFHAELHTWTVNRLAEVIRAAASDPRPVTAGSNTRTLSHWNRNRRGGHAVDRDLTVTRVDSVDGQPLAVLVNWTAHPTFMDDEHMEFSGGWPGHLQRTLEALIGHDATVLYFNGAEGDQSPTPRDDGAPAWEQAERYGRELGIEAWHAWQACRTQRKPTFAWQSASVALPAPVAHQDFMLSGGKEYGMSESNVAVLLNRLCPTETHTTAVRLGDLVIAAVPGEMTAELGLEVKSAIRTNLGSEHVAIGGLANEWVSYMLSPEEYRRGGYEASVSFYGETLGPELVRQVTENAKQFR